MQSDFTIIKKQFPKGTDHIALYPIGDVHIGSRENNYGKFIEYIERVKNDPNGYALICGDMLDMGLAGSKTNIYEQMLTPQEQKELLYELLLPIKDKILAVVPGNHEDRMMKNAGVNPLYDVCCRLQIEDVYREHLRCLSIKINNHTKNYHYTNYVGVITHGRSNAKHQKFTMSIDGADFFVSGHTHTPSYNPRGKLRVDASNGVVKQVGYSEIVVNAFLEPGGYGIAKEYLPPAPIELQTLILDGYKKRMTYTTTQL